MSGTDTNDMAFTPVVLALLIVGGLAILVGLTISFKGAVHA